MPVIVGGSVLAGLGCNGRLLMPRISKPSTHGLLFWLVWVVGWWVHVAPRAPTITALLMISHE